ncbi:MAG: rhodanese-like domain-containing protein [Gammaproteobacteria bacterium]
MPEQITNIAGYQFSEIDDVTNVFEMAQAICSETHIKGNIFISPEGINLGLASTQSDIEYFLEKLDNLCGLNNLLLNTTYSDYIPFKRLLIKVRNELVPTKPLPSDHPSAHAGSLEAKPLLNNIDRINNNAQYISNDELKKWLDDGKDITLLDMRNEFEVDLGSFENATHLKIRNFRDIIQLKSKINELPKDKPLVTFCTGGIRCEKGANILAQNGFDQVFQLEGGIIKYIEKYKNTHWRGECFVFDDRVCLNSDLKPSDTKICRHCQIVIADTDNEYCDDCAHLA